MNNLTYREKFTCEMIWGGVPTDTDYVRGSNLFNDGLKRYDSGEWAYLDNEIWKDCIGYEGIYQISNLGRVKSLSREFTMPKGRKAFYKEKFLTPQINDWGYKTVRLYNSSREWKVFSVHALVAFAFIGERPLGLVINHKDGVKSNNTPSNLEYVTNKENINHAINSGLKIALKGSAMYNSTLSCSQVIEIRNKYNGTKKYKGLLMDLGKEYGVSNNVISNIVKNKSYKL